MFLRAGGGFVTAPGTDFGLLSLATPLAAVVLALLTRQVYLSLLFGVVLGQVILAWPAHGALGLLLGLQGSVDTTVGVLTDPGNARVVLFVALVGAVLLLAQRTGGVEGFVRSMTRLGVGKTRRRAQLFVFVVGVLVFIETSISCMVTGAVGRPVCDRLKISREKLSFLCDSTSAPVCALLLFNAWGALILQLMAASGVEEGRRVDILLRSIPLNFYSLAILALALLTALTGWEFGPMAKAERRAREMGKVLADGARPLMAREITEARVKEGVEPRARHFTVPILVMLLMMPVGLYLTGLQKAGPGAGITAALMRGSGSTAVLWAVLAALAAAVILAKWDRILGLGEAVDLAIQGAGGLASMAFLMLLAFAIGATCKSLGTGPYVEGLLKAHLTREWLAPLLFVASCLVSFATGTSFGTLAVMIPIGVPAAAGMGVHESLAVAAVLSGGVFGDHCSPISDTTLMSSMASAADHVDHVKTQLPYAFTAAALAFLGFYLAGL